MFDTSEHLVNPGMIAFARERLERAGLMRKASFVSADGMGGGGDPSGGDPSGGGMGGDPSGGGGAPPMDPSAMGGGGAAGGGSDPALTAKLDQVLQAVQAGGGQAGPGGQPIKPKIDVNVEIMQMKNMLARIVDALKIPIPAQEMTATPDKLTQMAQQQQQAGQPGAGAGAAGAGGAGAAGGSDGSQIPPVQPMQGVEAGLPGGIKGASHRYGEGYSGQGLTDMGNKAAAIRSWLQQKGRR